MGSSEIISAGHGIYGNKNLAFFADWGKWTKHLEQVTLYQSYKQAYYEIFPLFLNSQYLDLEVHLKSNVLPFLGYRYSTRPW
jgi:hypothetical protein